MNYFTGQTYTYTDFQSITTVWTRDSDGVWTPDNELRGVRTDGFFDAMRAHPAAGGMGVFS